jgi:transcriptional regulator with XRE-family HTH domain
MAEKRLKPSRVAKLIGVSRSTVLNILNGKTKSPSRANLDRLAKLLSLETEDLQSQCELFQIDEEFVRSAHDALDSVIRRLGEEVGQVAALSVSGSIGVHFHGVSPNERNYQRVFAVHVRRKAG